MPIYDEQVLRDRVSRARRAVRNPSKFYESSPDISTSYQGDLISLEAPIPVLNHVGHPAKQLPTTGIWMVIGNTCDIARELSDAEWTQIAPVISKEPGGIEDRIMNPLLAYMSARQFYLPPWNEDAVNRVSFVDFLMPVALHKSALCSATSLLARLSMDSWQLFNCCIVRFFGRNDGRWIGT